jgi:predicted ATPase/class 3 adenylate cyclase
MSYSDQAVTFLFTDIEGSTRLWETCPDLMRQTIAVHDDLLAQIIDNHQGHLFKTVGDGVYAAFTSAKPAAMAAAAIQRAVADTPWELPKPLSVRIALHTGEAHLRQNDYFGLALSRCARLLEIGHGGQTLCSETTEQFLRSDLPADTHIVALGQARLKSLRRPDSVFQINFKGVSTEFPALRSLETYIHNLPIQLTSFVGRDKELNDIQFAAQASRLVTITGPGGSGKTRLALQAGADMLDNFDRGVWLVELASITDPDLVASAIASVLNVREEPGIPLSQSIVRAYAGGNVLIILDNCEHVIDSVAQLVYGILATCPNVKIMATSRERLHVPGEALVRVPAMTLPRKRARMTAADLLENDCTRLFIERATAVQPTFTLTDTNAGYLAQICHRLDGIPLALELAAARANLLSLEQMAQRLADRFRFLSGGSRTMAARQRTLEATIGWSFDLLTEPERELFVRLTVFVGGWTLEAAEEVCSGDGIEHWQVLELLDHLVNKSLVTVDDGATPRYRLLESLRSYGVAKRQESAADLIMRLHAAWFSKLVKKGSQSSATEQVQWMTVLDAEIDNVRTAIDFTRTADWNMCLQLSSGMYFYWYSRGHLSEGVDTLTAALKGAENQFPREIPNDGILMLRSKALSNLAVLYWAADNLDEAEKTILLAMEVCIEMGDEEGTAVNQNNLAIIASSRGDFELMGQLNQKALAYYRKVNDRPHIAACLANAGTSVLNQLDYDTAERHLLQAIAIYEECSDLQGKVAANCSLCEVYFQRGQFEKSAWTAQSGLNLASRTGDRDCQVVLLEILGAALVRMGWPEDGVLLLASATSARNDGVNPRNGLGEDVRRDVLAAADVTLSGGKFISLNAVGAAMTLGEAIAQAATIALGTTHCVVTPAFDEVLDSRACQQAVSFN